MSTFLPPSTLKEEIQQMIDSLWWRTSENQGRGIRWLSYDKLTTRNKHGGMSFRHLYGFNFIMPRKQGWCFLTSKDTIFFTHFQS